MGHLPDPKTLSIASLRSGGWQGFMRIGSLAPPYSAIPKVKGVYLILCELRDCPAILPKSIGGWFKGKDPSVDTDLLAKRWVEETPILYVGKAGGSGHATLRSRLRQYLDFGKGKPVGHWGGRYIWQVADSADLLVCWKPMPQGDPAEEERKLIQEFMARHGKLPFANIKIG